MGPCALSAVMKAWELCHSVHLACVLELPPCAVEDGGEGWEAEQVPKAQRYGPGTLRVDI